MNKMLKFTAECIIKDGVVLKSRTKKEDWNELAREMDLLLARYGMVRQDVLILPNLDLIEESRDFR